jgi:hypothetical protein
MSNVLSLCDYRARRHQAAAAAASADPLTRAQESLAQASMALHGITTCLDEVARRLGRPDEGARERNQNRIGRALEKLNQARADAAELTRLIEAGDIAGCERLRAAIQGRGEA